MSGHDSPGKRAKHMPRNFSVVATIDTIIRERDEARMMVRRVVGYCIESRTFEPRALQAAWLRDTILTDVDPLMIITQQLRDETK